jgi:hypothetical protein
MTDAFTATMEACDPALGRFRACRIDAAYRPSCVRAEPLSRPGRGGGHHTRSALLHSASDLPALMPGDARIGRRRFEGGRYECLPKECSSAVG